MSYVLTGTGNCSYLVPPADGLYTALSRPNTAACTRRSARAWRASSLKGRAGQSRRTSSLLGGIRLAQEQAQGGQVRQDPVH